MVKYKERGSMLPRITEDGTTLASPWKYYSLNAAGEEVKNLKADGFTFKSVGTGVIGIMGSFKTEDLGVVAGQILRLSAMSNPKGLKLSMICQRADGINVGSWSVYPAGTGDPAVNASYTEIEIHSEASYVYIQISNTTTSPNGVDIVVSEIDLQVEATATTNKLMLQRRPKGSISNIRWQNVAELTSSTGYVNQLAGAMPWSHSTTSGETVEVIGEHTMFWSFLPTRNAFNYNLTLSPNTTYTLSAKEVSPNAQVYVRVTDGAGTHNYYMLRDGIKTITFTTPATFHATTAPMVVVNVRDGQETGVGNALMVKEVMLNIGSTALSYEPFQASRKDGYFEDRTAGAGDVEYRIVATNYSTGATSVSNNLSTTNILNDTILSDPANPNNFIVLPYVTARSHDKGRHSTLLKFAGRLRPVREYGGQRSIELKLDWYARTWNEAVLYEDWFLDVGAFLYRDATGRYFYATADEVSTSDELVNGFRQSTTLTETDFNGI